MVDALQGMRALSKKALQLGIEEFITKFFNQDGLECYFGDSRALRGRNTNPTPLQFQENFLTLLIKRLSGPKIFGSNVDYVEEKNILFTFKKFLEEQLTLPNDFCKVDEERARIGNTQEERNSEQRDEPDVKRKALQTMDFCETCSANMTGEQYQESIRMAKSEIQKHLDLKWNFRKLQDVLYEDSNGSLQFTWNSCKKHQIHLQFFVGYFLADRVIKDFCSRKNRERKLEEMAKRENQKQKRKQTEKVITQRFFTQEVFFTIQYFSIMF